MKPIAFATALLALTGVSYAAASENWVCGIPTLVDPTKINLLDLDILGDYLVVNSQTKGVNLRLAILHNDDHNIIFRWHEATTNDTIPVELGVIDKVLGSLKTYKDGQIDGDVEGLISAGSCQRFER
jgi:hypothetical protein